MHIQNTVIELVQQQLDPSCVYVFQSTMFYAAISGKICNDFRQFCK